MYFQITEKLFTTPFKKRLDAKKASRVNLMRVLLETERLQYALRNVPVLKNHHGPWSRWMCRILRRANRAKAAPALTNALIKATSLGARTVHSMGHILFFSSFSQLVQLRAAEIVTCFYGTRRNYSAPLGAYMLSCEHVNAFMQIERVTCQRERIRLLQSTFFSLLNLTGWTHWCDRDIFSIHLSSDMESRSIIEIL